MDKLIETMISHACTKLSNKRKVGIGKPQVKAYPQLILVGGNDSLGIPFNSQPQPSHPEIKQDPLTELMDSIVSSLQPSIDRNS